MALESQQAVSLYSSFCITICLDSPALDTIMGEEVLRPASPISYHYEAFNDKESIRILTLYPSKSLSAAIHIKLSIVKVAGNSRISTIHPSGKLPHLLSNGPTEVLWRTMCWDADESGQSPSSLSPAEPFHHFASAILSDQPIEKIEKDILKEAACGFNDICVHSMPLCITEDGFLASVPWTAREGDRVFVFCGGQTPFLLRRDDRDRDGELKGEREGKGVWRLVGACYVHGIMRGDAFPLPEDARKLE